MSEPTHYSPVATSFASALIQLAEEQHQSPHDISGELNDMRDLMQADPMTGRFFADPSIGETQRTAVLDKALGGRVSPLFYKFIGLLNRKGRLALLPEIASAYKSLLDAKDRKVEVEVAVAHPLEPAQLDEVGQKVSQALGKGAIVTQRVDESIIGGIVLRIGDRLIDGSVKTQLQAIRQQLLSHRPGPQAWTNN